MDGQSDPDLTGQSALVTGSTAGVGKSIATKLGSLGASVVVNGRSVKKGETVVKTIKKAGGDALFHEADITDYNEVRELVNATADAFDGIDILVANGAASAAPTPDFFENTAAEDLLAWCKYGYLSRLYPTKAALEYLKGGGRVVFITADAGKVATPAETGPGATAAAVNMRLEFWPLSLLVIVLPLTRWPYRSCETHQLNASSCLMETLQIYSRKLSSSSHSMSRQLTLLNSSLTSQGMTMLTLSLVRLLVSTAASRLPDEPVVLTWSYLCC